MPVITSPSQLFRFNDRRDPTHLCFVYQLEEVHFTRVPIFHCFSTTGTLFRVRNYANRIYTCELYVPANGSPEISNPTWLGMCVADEFRRRLESIYTVRLIGVEDYTRYHSESTDEDDCYI